jgi:ABC-type branched-subunit amino acid transport system ATPase component/ABC-type branched-subunit amino acid transport system permease subunit
VREGTAAARPGPGLGAAGAVPPHAILVGVLLLVPAVFTRVPLYTMGNGVQMAIVAVAALGLVPLTGYARQVSIGQAAFYGTGAYTSAILTVRLGLPPLAAAAAGLALAAATAWLLGLLLFRVQGHYLALATIGLGLVLTILARAVAVTGGSEGLAGVPALAPFGFELAGDVGYWYLAGGVLVVAVLAVAALLRSRVGRALVAVGDAPVAAAASGIDIAAHRRLAFMVSAVLAAGAGSLYAHWVGYVDPSTLDLPLSLQLLIVATAGGLRTVWGPPVGAFLVVSLLQLSQETLPQVSERVGGQTEVVAYGFALVLVLLILPDGVAGTAGTALAHRLRAARSSRGEAAPGRGRVRRVVHSPGHSPVRNPVRLELDRLTVGFGGVLAVEHLTLCHDAGGVLGLIGPNGAGKTTLLNVLSGTVRPTGGEVRLDGRAVGGRRPDRLARAGVERTFQHLETFGSLSVLENVLVPLEARNRFAPPARLRSEAGALLDDVGLAGLLDVPVSALPLSTQRRVEVARALAGRPRLLLLDEPLAGLSLVERDELAALVRRVAESGVTVVLVEHDVAAVMRTSDRVVVLDHGRLLADGPPARVQADERVRGAYLRNPGKEPAR